MDNTTRVSDTDRELTAERLRTAVGDGRLDLPTYDERVQLVYAATTRADLSSVTADLGRPAKAVATSGGSGAWPAAWRTWASFAVLMVGIWAVTSLLAGDVLYFWPVWPIGGWAASMPISMVAGGRSPGGCRTGRA